jgi:hypothetical protein
MYLLDVFHLTLPKKTPLLRIKINKLNEYDQRQGLAVCKLSNIIIINTKM